MFSENPHYEKIAWISTFLILKQYFNSVFIHLKILMYLFESQNYRKQERERERERRLQRGEKGRKKKTQREREPSICCFTLQ